jgi:peptide/nickel transport system substrate-binding protein
MRRSVWLAITVVVILSFLLACAAVSPTTAPTKPAAPAVATAAPAPAVATSAPAAATKPAAAAPTAAPVAKVKRGGTLIYARNGDTNSWDPILQTSGDQLHELPLSETLLRYHELDETTGKSEYRGELAESWQIVDPLTIVFKLRQGVKFHDGTNFNAEAAKWVIDRAKTHPKSGAKVWSAFIKSVDAVDPYTLRLNLAYTSALVFANLTRASGGSASSWSQMISKAAVEKLGDDFGTQPVGTGPVMMVQWMRDDKALFKKFDGYWMKGADGQPLPYYDALTARVIPDPAALLSEMRSGAVHITQSVEPVMFATIKSNPDLVLRSMPTAPWRIVFGLNQHRPPFKDNLKLRQALQYAIDRKAIADATGFGEFQPNYYVLSAPGFPGWDESLPRYDYQPEKAKQLLKEAGYPDGIDFGFIVPTSSMQRQPGEMIQAQLTKIGLRARMDVMESIAARSKQKALEFDSMITGMSPSLDMAHYERMYKCDGAANWSTYCNAELDKCLEEGQGTFDFDKRAETYKRCWKIIYEDALVGGAVLRPFFVLYNKTLKGLRYQSYAMDLREVWIDK